MSSPSLADIVRLITDGSELGSTLADQMYKKVNEILDQRVASYKASFAEEGTNDLDAMKWAIATHFTHQSIDHGLTSALLIAAIYRMARQ
jgi:hypothetical protein